ncbi:phage tail protein [Nitrosomonas sp.]|uniref:phage tail protein n=1 Tax=Nitrosomonas sp. TaxID=42353 RepID=UPI0032ED9056
MAAMTEHNIYRAYNFILDLGGGTVGYFSQVNFMGINVPYYEYREGGAGPAVRKLPGRVSYSDIELKWGLTESTEMMDWLMSAVKGEVIRKNISIILKDTDGQKEVTRWNVENAFPCSWKGAQLDALSNEAAIETLCITHEGLTRA